MRADGLAGRRPGAREPRVRGVRGRVPCQVHLFNPIRCLRVCRWSMPVASEACRRRAQVADRATAVAISLPYAVWWLLPGGKVEFGEPVEHAARRQATEESGCEVRKPVLTGAYEILGPGHHFVMWAYRSEVGRVPERFAGHHVRAVRQERWDRLHDRIVRSLALSRSRGRVMLSLRSRVPGGQPNTGPGGTVFGLLELPIKPGCSRASVRHSNSDGQVSGRPKIISNNPDVHPLAAQQPRPARAGSTIARRTAVPVIPA